MRVSERMLGDSIPGGRLGVSREGRTKWRLFTHPKQWGRKKRVSPDPDGCLTEQGIKQ